jgi:hypothetical protein
MNTIDRFEDPVLQRLLGLYYPRAYQAPHEYPSFKAVAQALCRPAFFKYTSQSTGNRALFDEVMQDAFAATGRLLHQAVPTYFVDKSILQAILETDPPEDTALDSLEWPMEALLFVLPKGTLVSLEDGDCPYLVMARHKGGQEMSLPAAEVGSIWFEQDCFTFTTSPIGKFEMPVFATSTNSTDSPLIRDVVKKDFPGLLFGKEDAWGVRSKINLPENDRSFLRTMMDLSFRLLMLMLARPDMVSAGRALPQAEKLKKKGAKEVWTPNFIGRGYVPRQEPKESIGGDSGTKHGPRTHWRRGHYRSQPYGPKMSLRKLIWMEPMLIAA